jgi:hypothetical protein
MRRRFATWSIFHMTKRIGPFAAGMRRAVIVLLAAAAVPAYAESDAGCAALIRFGVYDKFQTFTPETRYQLIQSFFANNPFPSRRDVERNANGLDLSAVLDLQPGGKHSETEYIDWGGR